jgi:Kef-type K+ transport system membrane component KefB
VGRLHARGALIVFAMVFAVWLAAVADLVGLATIIGAFAAAVGMKVEPAMLDPFGERAWWW